MYVYLSWKKEKTKEKAVCVAFGCVHCILLSSSFFRTISGGALFLFSFLQYQTTGTAARQM